MRSYRTGCGKAARFERPILGETLLGGEYLKPKFSKHLPHFANVAAKHGLRAG